MAVADIFKGPVAIWRAPVGETLPDESTVAYGAAWGGNWATYGYTKTPTSFNPEYENADVMIQESLAAVDRFRTAEKITIETTLAELTGDNLEEVLEGTKTVTAAAAAQVGMTEVESGDEFILTKYAWGLEGLYQTDAGDQFPVRFFLYKGTVTIGGPLEFGKEDYPGITCRIEGIADLAKDRGKRLFKFQKVTAAVTGP